MIKIRMMCREVITLATPESWRIEAISHLDPITEFKNSGNCIAQGGLIYIRTKDVDFFQAGQLYDLSFNPVEREKED